MESISLFLFQKIGSVSNSFERVLKCFQVFAGYTFKEITEKFVLGTTRKKHKHEEHRTTTRCKAVLIHVQKNCTSVHVYTEPCDYTSCM